MKHFLRIGAGAVLMCWLLTPAAIASSKGGGSDFSAKPRKPKAPAHHETVIGSVTPTSLTVKEDKTERTFVISQFTEITVNGQKAKTADLEARHVCQCHPDGCHAAEPYYGHDEVVARVPAIGITGGISTGKTTFSGFLKSLLPAATFFDADAAARQLVQTDPEVKREIEANFGAGIYSTEGDLNRSNSGRSFSLTRVRGAFSRGYFTRAFASNERPCAPLPKVTRIFLCRHSTFI